MSLPRPSVLGFLPPAKSRKPDLNLNSNVRILVNDQQMYENETMRWQSVDHFLQQALGAVAMLADRPAGETLPAAQALILGVGILAVVGLAARTSLLFLFFQFGEALLLFCGTLGDALVHLLHVDILDAETGGK